MLADLGDPAALNTRLRRTYLTTEEARWLDSYVAAVWRPVWAYGLLGSVLVLTVLQGAGWAAMWGLWLVTALALTLRAVLPRFTSPRRTALLLLAVMLPAQLLGLAGPLPETQAQWVTALTNVALVLGGVWAVLILPRFEVWRKVFLHG